LGQIRIAAVTSAKRSSAQETRLPTDIPTPLITDPIRSFLTATPRHATLATINHDGSPHQIVIWYLLRGDSLVINSRHGRRWPSNVRRDPRASLCVFEGEDNVIVSCEVEDSYEGEGAQADIAEMAYRYYSPELARSEIARYRTERRLTFVMRPTRIHTHGDPR
jgi:PPOX class probable F420-dependent enzyme